MSAISVKNLNYFYPNVDTRSLIDIELNIEKGEFVLICGSTGAGKTTLCRTLLGLIPHFFGGIMEGEVNILGVSTRETTPSKLAARVGMVFQNPEDQLVKMRVEDEIAFGPENLGLPHNEIKSRVNEALKLLNISDLRTRSPHELSSGQQQKVAISSILAMNPEILILDEPTSQLDPLSAVEIINFVKKLNVERGITVIIAEHRLENVARFADKMVVLNNGRIFSIGPTRKIMSDERLPEIGVSLPKIVQLTNSLKEKGIHLETLPLTINEAVELFRRMVR